MELPTTPDAISIRYATTTDNELLAQVGAQTFYDTFAIDNTPMNMQTYLASAFSPEIQARELADPQIVFLIVEIDQNVVGYAQLRQKHAPLTISGRYPIELGRFYVQKEWHGRGVAAALMRACLTHAAHTNTDTIWLDVWENNPRAIAFYRKWGFTPVGTQTFLLGADLQTDLLMQRPVNL